MFFRGAGQAPFPAAGQPKVEEGEAVDDRQLAAIEQREKAARRMRHEIRDRDIAGKNEGNRAGKQAESEQKAADQLDQALRTRIESQQVEYLVRLLVRKIEHLGGA